MPNMVSHEGRCYIVNDTKYRIGGGGGGGAGRGKGRSGTGSKYNLYHIYIDC